MSSGRLHSFMPLYTLMVLRVVSQMTQQLGHSCRCFSSLARISALVHSSRKSFNSPRNSLHVSKGVVSFAFEESGELFAQLQASSEEAALDGGDRQIQRFGSFFGR